MIVSFGNKLAKSLFHGESTKETRAFPPELVKKAVIRLDALSMAMSMQDLRCPPGNRLERLKGDLANFHSIRINDQWRIIFKWREPYFAEDVAIVDYH